MHIDWIAMGQVVIAGLVAGVGTVVVFSLGMAALGHRVVDVSHARKATAATTAAWSCFGACLALLAVGVYLIIGGR
jgi:hypothetical protein